VSEPLSSGRPEDKSLHYGRNTGACICSVGPAGIMVGAPPLVGCR
jgi:hypothetical protein